MSKKNICLIPLRGGSKGIPKKNITLLNNKPLCYYVIKSSLKSTLIDETWVSTDDDEIEEICLKLGCNIHRRNINTGTDTATSDSVILDFLSSKKYDSNNYNLLFIQATNPFVFPEDLDSALLKFNSSHYDMMIGVNKTHNFIWRENKEGDIYLVNTKVRRRQDAPKEFLENGSYYIYDIKKFYDGKLNKIGYNINTSKIFVDIDEHFDLEIAEKLSDYLPKFDQ
jgi:CMP-N-acetylneuraminic acid synthetase